MQRNIFSRSLTNIRRSILHIFTDGEFRVFEYQDFLSASLIQNDPIFESIRHTFSKSEITHHKILIADGRNFLSLECENRFQSNSLWGVFEAIQKG